MCGIAGFIQFKNPNTDRELLSRMSLQISRRGPDGEGHFFAPHIGLAHRRLAIIDLSENAHQPMIDQKSGCVLILNGEIYNYLKLKNELLDAGIDFHSKSDTEVLLKGLVHFGVSFLEKVDGDFAFAFWNPKIKELWLARDRFGVKPLYIYKDSDRFIFASEIKAILEAGISITPNKESLESYFGFRYVRGSKTMFEGIEKLPPAHMMKITLTGYTENFKYWELNPMNKKQLSFEDARDELQSLLKESIKNRLNSDRNLGVFLSGGVDSALIAAIAKHESTKSFDTFTYQMPGSNDESALAGQISEELGLGNSTIFHRSNDYQLMERVAFLLEEPIGDSIVTPNYRLFDGSHKAAIVALTGEGADELFGGYAHHNVLNIYDLLVNKMRIPGLNILSQGMKYINPKIMNRFLPYPVPVEQEMLTRCAKLFQNSQNPLTLHYHLAQLMDREERSKVLNSDWLPNQDSALEYNQRAQKQLNDYSFMQQIKLFDLKNWLPDYGLLRIDKLSMANGQEVRVPYLYHKLVEFIFSLDEKSLSHKRRQSKPLLRDLASAYLPKSVATRKKLPFFLDKQAYDTEGHNKYLNDLLDQKSIAKFGVLNPHSVAHYKNSAGSTFLHQKKAVNIAMFQLWCRLFLDGKWRHGIPS